MNSSAAPARRAASSSPVRPRHVAALLAALAALPASGTTITYLDGQPAYSAPISTTLANPYTLDLASGTATQSGLISGNGFITKTGAGTLTLSANNTYTGATTVDAGTLRLTGTAYSQGSVSGSITVNSGATLALNRSDIFGFHTAVSPVSITINAGGLVTNTGVASYNTLNNLTLNGGTLYADSGANASYPAYQLKGTVTAGGSSASLISTSGAANSQIQLGNNTVDGTTTFNVADVTSNGADDLVVSATLQDGRNTGGTAVASGLIKTGSGTLLLSGANTFTGPVALYAGTLGIGSNQALGDSSHLLIIGGGNIRAAGSARTVANPLQLNGSFTVGRLTTFTGTADLGADITITADNYDGPANGNSTFNGVISGAGRSVTIAEGPNGLGTGAIVFGGANTYDGSTTVQSGRLVLTNTSASSAYVIDSGAVLELSVASGDIDLPTATFSGAGTLRKSGAGSVYWGSGAGTFALGSGALIDVQGGLFRGGWGANEDWSANLSDLNVAAGASFNSVEANVRVDALTGSGTIASGLNSGGGYQNFTFGVDGGSGTFAGILADNGGEVGNYVKAGAGTQTLTGASTYTGSTTLAGGTLALGSAGALGNTNSISFTGGTLQFSVANTTDYSAVFDATAGQFYRFDTNGEDVALASALTSSGGSLVKLGAGTLTLSGANTFSGGVTVSDGTLRATTSSGALGAGSLTLAGGDLALANDFNLSFGRPTTVSADATITIDRLTSGSVFTLTHTLGTLSIGAQTLSSARGANITSGTGAVAFGNTTLTGDAVFSPGLNTQINLSFVSQTGGPRSLTVDGAGTLNLQSSTGTYTGVTTVRGGGVLLVTNSIGNGGVSSPIGMAGSDAANLVIDGGTLRLTNNTNTNRLFTLGTNGGTLDASGGIVLFNNPGAIALAGSDTSRTLTLTGSSTTANLLTPALGDNGTGVTSLNKTGNGAWILAGANTYTGTTTVSAGTLGLTGTASLASSNLVLGGGGVLAHSGSSTPAVGTGPGQVQFGTGGGGFAAYAGPLTVTTFASTPIWGTGGVLADNVGLSLGSGISTHALTLPSAIDLGTGQTRSFNVFDNTATPDDLVILSGVVSGASSTFFKNGPGTLVLTTANSYAGTTTVANGTLALADSGTISAANLNLGNGGVLATNDGIGFSRAFGTGAGQVQLTGLGGGFAAYGGPLTLGFAGNPVWGSTSGFGGNLYFGSVNADDVVTWTTPFSLGSSNRTLQVNDNAFSTADYAVVSGVISGNTNVGLTKSGIGTLVLSGANTYTGTTTISGGTLAVTSLPSVGAGPGSLGEPTTVANGTIVLTGGTLRYTGAGDITDRVLSLPSTAAATVEASGSGPIVFTSDLSVTGGNTKSFTLGGTSTAANEFRGAIVNNSAINLTQLAKTGPGTWLISGTNTYTGATTVSDGTLRLGSSSALANSALTVNATTPGGTAVLDLNGFDATVSSLTLGGNTGASPTSSAHVLGTGGGTLSLGGNVTYNTTGSPLGSTISAGLNLGSATRIFTVNDSPTAAIDLAVTGNIGQAGGTAGLTKSGTGTLLLSGANTYAGDTTLSQGTLIAGSDSAFGTGNLLFSSGTLQGDGTPRTLANAVSLTTTVPVFGGAGDLTLTGLLTNNTNNNPTLSFTNTGATTLGPIALANSGTSRSLAFQTTGGLVTLGGVVANGGGSTASGIAKIGSGTLALAAANTYGGATIVADGTLRLDVDGAIPSASAVTLNAPAAATPLTLDLHGHATTVGSLSLASGNFASAQVVDSSGGGLLLLGGNLTYNAGGALASTGSTISAALDLGTATRTFTVNDSAGIATDLVISGAISDTTLAGLTKTGGGTLALTGANTYRGATTIAAGTLAVDSLPSVGAGPGPLGAPATVADGTLALAGGTLRYTGASASITDRVVNLSGGSIGGTLDASGMGAFVFTSAFTATGSGSKTLTLTGTNGGGNSIQGAIVNGSGTTSVTKTGSGTWLLSGANTYTGATTVNDGTLALGASGALTLSSLAVASSLPGGTATFDLNGFNATVPGLTLGGATGSTSASLSQVVGTGGGVLSLGVNGVTYSSTNNNAGALVSAGLDLGASTRTFTVNDSTAADADLTVSGSIASSGGGLAKSGLGTLVLSGVNTYTGSTTVSQGVLRLGSATALPATALTIASNNTGITAALDLNGYDLTVASLTFGGAGTSTSVSNLIATGGGTLILGGDLTYNSINNPLGSTLAAAVDLGATSGRTFNIADSVTASSDLTVSGSIGETLASTALIKTGSGVLSLTAANTYTGPTLVNGGVLALTGSGTISAANLALSGGVFATNDALGFSRPLGFGNGQVQIGNNGGFAAHDGNLTLSAFTGTPEWGLTPGFIPSGSTLVFGSTGADGVVTWTNPFSLGAGNTRTIQVNDNTATAADLAVLSGVISSGVNGALTKAGAGTLVLTAANTYTGQTSVTGGTLAVTDSGALSAANLSLNGGVFATNNLVGFSRAFGTGAGQVQLGFSGGGFAAYGGPLTLSSFTGTPVWGSTAGFFSSGGSTLLLGSVNATDVVTWTNDFSLGSSNRIIQVTDNLFTAADSAVISGVISGDANVGLTKSGNGTLVLSGANTYTGPTSITGGVLSISSLPDVGAGAGSLGAPTTVANGTIGLNNATLRYTGAAAGTTDRVINLSGFGVGGTLDASGAGPLVFTSALTATGSGNKILTLTGTSTAANAFQGAIVNGSGVTSLAKTGSGNWLISGTNTYTGTTTVNDGTLLLGSSSSLPNTGLIVASNVPGGLATLDLNGFNATVSSLTLGDAAGSSAGSGSQVLATGGGTLTLGGNVTFNSVNNPAGASIAANLNLGSGATRTFTVADSANAGGDLVVSGIIGETSSSGLTKSGPGALLLSGANTYTGTTTLSAGTLVVGSDTAFGTGPLSLSGGILQGNGAPRTLANAVNVTSSAPGLIGGTSDLTFTGTLSNTFLNNYATLTVSNSGATSLAGPVSLGTSTGGRGMVFNTTGGLVTLAGSVSNGPASSFNNLYKTGSGILELGAANTYTGSTVVLDGTLRLGAGGTLGTGGLAIIAGYPGATAIFDLNGRNITAPGITLGGTGSTTGTIGAAGGSGASPTSVSNLIATGGGTITLAGSVFYQATGNPLGSVISADLNFGTGSRTFFVNDSTTAAIDLTVAGDISETVANSSLNKSNAGTLLLSGTNTYTGATNVNDGTLRLGSAAALPATTLSLFSSSAGGTAVLDLGGYDASTFGLTFSGISATNAAHLAATGGGTLTLLGNAGVTYSATSNPLGSVLSAGLNLGSATRTFNIGDSANAAADLTVSGDISATVANVGLTKTGTGTLLLSGANTYGGPTTINDGTVRLGASTALPAGTALTIASNVSNGTALLDLNGQNASVSSLSFGGINASALTNSASHLAATGGGALTLSGALTYSPLGSPLGSVVSADLLLSSGSVQLFHVGDSLTVPIDLTISGAIGETVSSGFAKSGAGTLLLSGANTYTGPTLINDGTVLLGAAGSLSSGSAISLANSSRARLDLAGYDQVIGGLSGGGALGGNVSLGSASLTVRGGGSYSGLLAGTGALVKEGSATLSLPTVQPYTGGTTLRAGTLELGQDGSLGSGTLTVTGGTLAPLGGSRTLAQNLTLDGSFGLASTAANQAFSFTGPVTLAGDSTVAATQAAGSLDVVHTFSGVIDGAHALTLSRQGAASLGASGGFVLSGVNTFSGGLTLDATRLFVASDSNLGDATGGLTLRNGAILQTSVALDTSRLLTVGTGGGAIEHGTNALTFTGLSGAGDLLKTGSGSLTLTGTSTYDGVLTATTDLVLAPAASLRFGPQGGTNTGIANDGILIFDSATTRSFDQVISGFGEVWIEGSSTGVFSLGAANTYTGDTTLRSGTLAFSALSNFGSAGDLIFGGGTLRWSAGNTADPSARFAPLASADASFDPNGQAVTLGTALTGNAGLILAGSGTLTLGAANTYAGNTTVRDGTLLLGAASALPATGVEIRSSAAGGTATLDLNGHDTAVSALTLGGATATSASRVLATGGGTLAVTGDIAFDATNSPLGASIAANLDLGSGATRTFVIGDSANADADLTVTGSLGQTSTSGLTKTGAGTLALGAVNTYTGLTTLQAGTLRLEVADALPSGNSVAIDDAIGARLDLAGHNQTLASLTGSGEVALGSATLTLSSGSYDGLLSGSGSLVKTSAGTLSLTRGNTYTGGTTLGAGTLALGFDTALGTGALTVTGGTLAPLGASRVLGNALVLDGDLTLASTSANHAFTFTGPATLARDLTLVASQASGTLDAVHTLSGNIGGAHALTLSRAGGASFGAGGGFVLSGANTFSGGLTVDATRLFVSSDANLGDAFGSLTLRNGATLAATGALASSHLLSLGTGGGVLDQGANAISFAGLSGSGNLLKTGSGTLTFTGMSTYHGTLTSPTPLQLASGASFRFGPLGTTNAGIANEGTLVFDSTTTRSFNPVISGSGAVEIEGNSGGVLTLGAVNTYAGGTTLRGGTLVFSSLDNLGSGNLTFAGGTLRWTAGNTTDISARLAPLEASGGTAHLNGQALTFATALTGTGGLALTGGGSLTLTGDSTFGGTLTIGAGTTVNLGAGGATGSLAGPVLNQGSLVINRANDLAYQGVLSGSGLFTKNGAGTLTLGGDNSGFSGASSLNAGTVALAHNAALGTGAATLNGASLETSGGARTVATPFRLNADTTLGGSDALTLTGSFTLLRNRDLIVENTAVTTFSGSIGQSGGGRGLNKYGAGELQLTGANTYSGGTYVGEGTVRINNLSGSAFGTGAVTVESGATLTGAGSFSGALQLNPGSTFAPGNSPGLATIGSGSVLEGTTLIEIAGLDRGVEIGGYDAIDVGAGGTGSVILGGELQVVFFGGYVPTGSASFQLLKAGSFGGSFAQVSLPSAPGYSWNISRLNTEGILELAAVPEPATLAGLAGLAAFSAAALRRRRKK